MNYNQYVDWMQNRIIPNGDYTTKNIKKLLATLDNPQDQLKIIHVSGTNGKGSVCAYIQNTLSLANVKCGLFTSPYIEDLRESIQIDGNFISQDDFVKTMDIIYPKVLELDEIEFSLTSFEVFFSLAITYFYNKKVQAAVIEVGMGGLNDATNVFKNPLASVLTSISLDHIGILGDSLEQIAYQKSGIIKKDSPIFIYPQAKESIDVIRKTAQEKNSEIFSFSFDEIENIISNEEYNEFSFRNKVKIKTSLLGNHQVYNACLSLIIIDYLKNYFKISKENISQGLYTAKNPGRIEIISKSPKIVLDGSHNAQSIDALVENIKNFSYDRLILGFSMLADKDKDYVLKKLLPLSDELILTTIDNPRASSLDSLEKACKIYKPDLYSYEDREKALNKSLELANKNDLVLWCGSLYLIKDIRKLLKRA